MERLKEFLEWHLQNPHNVNLKMIVAKEDREDTLKVMHEISELLDTGLDPDKIQELREPILKLQEHFGNTLTINQVVDSFVDFYIAQGDTDRVEEAVLLTNEAVSKYKELKERDTAKAPVDIDDEFDMYVCPSCNMAIGAMGNREEHHFCLNCGQRLKWEG